MKTIDYKNFGLDLNGSILINGEKSYIAVTASKSQAFRSMKGAEKFMAAREYQRIY